MSFKIKIFYAWQLHTKPEYNKNLIHSAITSAIKNLSGKGILKDVELVLEHDTKGIPGSPNINEEIDKKISESDIFICDLTNKNNGANGNVLVEYGQAKQAHCLTSIIGICNEAYGAPEDYLEFDISHNRFPITYECNQDEDIENTVASLANKIEQAIRAIAASVLENQDWKYKYFCSLTTFKKNFNELAGQFFSTEKIDEIIQAIRDNSTQCSKIRMIGLSGLGKTKIMLNALDTDELKWNVRYCDCGKEDSAMVKAGIEKMCLNKDAFYLVLDNCPQNLASEINYILKKHNIQMPVLSIFNDRTERTDDVFNVLLIDTEDTEEIVKSIISQRISKDEFIIQRLLSFAANNPQMAVLFAKAFKENPDDNLSILSHSQFLDKLLFNTADSDERIVLQSFSLFDFIGVENENRKQLKFISTNENITSLNGSETFKENLFIATYKKFLKRQIFEKKGSYTGIRPKPLAWYLLGEWLAKIDSGRMLNVINDIQAFDDSNGIMLESMCRQLAFMNISPDAVKMLEAICGQHGPFANADVVYTKMGSRLLRAFSEVNSLAVSGCLYNIISTTTVDKLKNYTGCRRDLVLTAQKLAFDKTTFKSGAEILFYLANAENERWANNATNSFTSLFSVHLPATSVNLAERVNILIEIKKKSNYQELYVKALQNALIVDAGFYMGGAEQQGTKHLQNYEPDDKEKTVYLDKCLSFLIDEIKLETSNADKVLCNCIRSLCRLGYYDLIIKYIKAFISLGKNNYDYLLTSLQDLLRFEAAFLLPEQKQEVLQIKNSLKSDDFVSTLKYIERDLRETTLDLTFEQLKELSIQNLKPLIDVFVNSKEHWYEYLLEIYKIDSLYISEFGTVLAEKIIDDLELSKTFVDISLRVFATADKFDNQIFLSFVKKCNNEIFDYACSKISRNNKLHKILFQLYGIRNVAPKDCSKLFLCITKHKSDISLFEFYWQYIDFNSLTDYAIKDFFEKLTAYKDSLPVVMSLSETLLMYRNSPIPNTTQFIASYLTDNIRKVSEDLSKYNDIYFNNKNKNTKFDYNSLSFIYNVCERLLKTGQFPELARGLNKYLLLRFVTDYSAGTNGYFESIYELLLENYFDEIWNELSSAIIATEKNIFQFMTLKSLLGYRDFPYGRSEPLINFAIHKEELQKWCLNQPEIAPKRLAELLKPYNIDTEGSVYLTDSSTWLLDSFGDDVHVCEALFIACGTYFVEGLMIPKLEEHKKFAEILLQNKNPNVAKWAKQKVNDFNRAIEAQKSKEDEEKFLYQ